MRVSGRGWYRWKALGELSRSQLFAHEVNDMKNFGARPKVFPISNGEVLKQFPLIDETISHTAVSKTVTQCTVPTFNIHWVTVPGAGASDIYTAAAQ